MESGNKYIQLGDLEVYQLARELSKFAWKKFELMTWEDRKIMDFQFVESADSIGANIAEGYERFHYLDRIKFYYNSRGSYNEFRYHWLDLMNERKKITLEEYNYANQISDKFQIKLNNFISSVYKLKK